MKDPIARVEATTSFVGYHEWPDASGARAYLAARHRHRFRVTAEMRVLNDDRDIEFHDLVEALDLIASAFPLAEGGGYELGARSCEALARLFGKALDRRWTGDVCSVRVAEDEDVAAVLRWE